MSPAWRTGLIIGGSAVAAAAVGYGIYRYLQPRTAKGATLPAPTNIKPTVKVVSARTAMLSVTAQTSVVAAAGATPVTVRWYHYYEKGGKLYPKLISQGQAVGGLLAFTFGITSQDGRIVDVVTPGQPYTFGVQVCQGGRCSPIVRVQVQVPAFQAKAG